MQQHELLEFVLGTLSELANLHAAATAAVERVSSVLDQQDKTDLHIVPGGGQHGCGSPQDRPMVDAATFTVEWHGQHCSLGPTILFKLIQHLARRPDRYFTHDVLMENVWEQRRSNATIRSAISRLRRAMCDAGMPELAAAIRGRRGCYGVFLHDNGS